MRTTREKFVKTYIKVYAQGGTYVDVAKLLGISMQQARARSYNYKRQGIILPSLRRSNFEMTVDELNDYIRNYR